MGQPVRTLAVCLPLLSRAVATHVEKQRGEERVTLLCPSPWLKKVMAGTWRWELRQRLWRNDHLSGVVPHTVAGPSHIHH